MTKGKMIVQGAHAVLGAVENSRPLIVSQWKNGFHGRKVCVYVSSEQELLDLHNKASESGLVSFLVKDIGLTMFKEPQFTAVCIGPDKDESIDKITGHLKLL